VNKKPLNPTVVIVLVILGVVVLGVAGYFGLIPPEGAKLKKIKADEQSAQSAIDDYNHKVQLARSAPKIRIADIYRLAKAMPTEEDMPDLVLELSQLARDSGIRFDSISPQPAVPIGSYTVLPISVTFNGTFYDLADLLYRLRSLVDVHGGRLDATGRLFTVDSLSFGESPLKFPRIQATLVIDAFIYGSGGAAPATSTPTPATTTSTDTTSTDTTAAATTSSTTTTPTSGTSASAAGAP
jgi:type II secretory pathway pseudopilin PulG